MESITPSRDVADRSPIASQRPQPSRRSAEQRLADLAAAVREHESTLRRTNPLAMRRAQDDHLYRRLRQICGG